MKNSNRPRITPLKRYAAHFLIAQFLLFLASGAYAGDGNPVTNAASDVGFMATSPARIDRSSAYITLGILGAGGLFYAFNNQIRSGVKTLHSATGDNLSTVAEKFGNPGTALAMVGVLGGAGHLLKDQKLENTALLSFESFLAANTFGMTTKYIVGLSRPYANKGDAAFKPFSFKTVDNSFPSGHTTTAFSIASVFSEQYDSIWVSILAYGLASTVAMQRVYADKHWASDVFFGAALGTVTGRLVVRRARQRAANKALTIYPYVTPQTKLGLGMKLAF